MRRREKPRKMLTAATKKVRNELVTVASEFYTKLANGEYDEVFEELITEKSSEILSSVAWPLMAYKEENLGCLFDTKLKPFPNLPPPNAWLLAFQRDQNSCRTALFRGIAEGIHQHQIHQFDPSKAIALKSNNYYVLSAPDSNQYFFLLFREIQINYYQVDFLSLLLFSMEVNASFLWEIVSYAESIGETDSALDYLSLIGRLKKPYLRVKRMICDNPDIKVKQLRKDQINQQIRLVEQAIEKAEVIAKVTQPFLNEKTSLPIEDYETILQTVMNMAIVMERSPEAFAELEEEQLRDHFLVQLNGQFPGKATGETFNYQGKTDILVRHENKNIFVAECKFWRGQKEFSEAIDQLLRYATWRDTRLALFIFNRSRNLSDVLNKLSDTLKRHPAFIREAPYDLETGYRAYLSHEGDSQRELLVTVLVFEVPQKKKV